MTGTSGGARSCRAPERSLRGGQTKKLSTATRPARQERRFRNLALMLPGGKMIGFDGSVEQ